MMWLVVSPTVTDSVGSVLCSLLHSDGSADKVYDCFAKIVSLLSCQLFIKF